MLVLCECESSYSVCLQMRKVNLEGVDLQPVKQKRMNFVDFTGAKLNGADFSGFKYVLIYKCVYCNSSLNS